MLLDFKGLIMQSIDIDPVVTILAVAVHAAGAERSLCKRRKVATAAIAGRLAHPPLSGLSVPGG
jgi:hypothetical protein